MRLDDIIKGIAITDRRGALDTEVSSITADSRKVRPGSLFVAVRGLSRDGHQFIGHALELGAAGVVAEQWPEGLRAKANVVLVPNARRALALAAGNFYGQPSRKLLIAGVTGTNGKTTVTYVLESIIKAAGKKVGVIGTVDTRFPGKVEVLDNTTPDAVLLQKKLAEMAAAGVSHVAMEVSSHALDQERVAGLHFKVTGFTNLSQDHLDYHKTLDTYFEAKARLFSEYLRKSRARGRMAVVNVDDARGAKLLERWNGKSLRVSLDPKSDADVVALSARYAKDGIEATIRTSKGVWDIKTALIGEHNLSNVLVAVGMALAMGFSKARILRGLEALERVPGRLERVPSEDGKTVYVDYAHTPDALSRALSAVRATTKGRLLVVFGCGGDRDATKRGPMGQAVAKHADIAVLTNDNPRTESPEAIAKAVEEGLKAGGFTALVGPPAPKTYKVELDRRHAIRLALDWAGPEDTVVIAGKGHEDYQIVGKQKLRFDDREEARRILAGLPPPPPEALDEGTSEVEVDQVVESLEEVEGDEILAEEVVTGPTTQQVQAEEIVDAVDLEPDIVEEIVDAPAQPEGRAGPPGDKKT